MARLGVSVYPFQGRIWGGGGGGTGGRPPPPPPWDDLWLSDTTGIVY